MWDVAPDGLCDPEPALSKLHSPGGYQGPGKVTQGVSAKKRSDPLSADVIRDDVFPLPVRALLKWSIVNGLESLLVHLGKLGLGKSLLSGPQVPLL